MKRVVLLAVLAMLGFGLISCGSMFLDDQMNKFPGQHIDQFIAKRGEPTKVVPLSNGAKLYEWNIVPGSQPEPTANTTGNINVSTSLQIGGKQKPKKYQWCNYRVVTDKDDIITEATWEGNYCRPAR